MLVRAWSYAGDESERGCEFIETEKGSARGGRVLQTRHDKGKCTYECTPDWLRDGFHGDQFARPGEVVAAAAVAAAAAAAVAVTTVTDATFPRKIVPLLNAKKLEMTNPLIIRGNYGARDLHLLAIRDGETKSSASLLRRKIIPVAIKFE